MRRQATGRGGPLQPLRLWGLSCNYLSPHENPNASYEEALIYAGKALIPYADVIRSLAWD